MPFEAKSLRVQLPCGPVTVIEAERHDAEVKARLATGWGNILTPVAEKDCAECATSTQLTGGAECALARLADLCHGTEPLDERVVVDVHVLPLLRKQLEARLKELDFAQEAVARKTGGK